ncbi:hypothetical protein NN561_017953 [Cricetulus griseus]
MRDAKRRPKHRRNLHSGPLVPDPLILISVKPDPILKGEVASPSPTRTAPPKATPPQSRGGGRGTGVGTALTGGSPAWSETSDPERQIQTRVGEPPKIHGLPAAGFRTPLPGAGPHASSARTGAPRTWYSASSSLDRRLPEPPIAAMRAQLRQLSPGLRQLSHFRPRGRVPAPFPQQPLPGLRPRARPCVQCPGTLGKVQPAGSRLPAGPGELEAGPGEEPDAQGRGPGRMAPPPEGRG